MADNLIRDLESALDITLIDPHTHIDPHAPAARNLDDLTRYLLFKK